MVLFLLLLLIVSILLLEASQGLKTLEGTMDTVAFPCHCPCLAFIETLPEGFVPGTLTPGGVRGSEEASGVRQVWGRPGSVEMSSFLYCKVSQTLGRLLEDKQVGDASGTSLAVEPPCSWSIS